MSSSVRAQFAGASRRCGTRGAWQRGNLAAWRAARDEERSAWDAAQLVSVHAAMGESATAAAALDWAQRHGIEIIVDHQTTAGGYYWPGSGVVAVSVGALRDMATAVEVLTHEIRHAWQDYHGLIYFPANEDVAAGSLLGRDLAIEGLFEADATAHGQLAGAEYRRRQAQERVATLRLLQDRKPERGRAELLKILEQSARQAHRACGDAAAALWRHFTGWYTGGLSCLYNRNRRGEYAAVLGLDAPMRGYGFSYQRPEGDFRLPPPDFSRREVLDQLGRSFAGVNYLASATARDTVARFLLPPGAAERGFPRITPAAGRDIGSVTDGLTRRIRAVQLRTQLAQAKKRLSLP